MNITKRNKVALAIGTGALVVGTAGAALAYWTTGGSGDGTASVSAPSTITVNQTGSSTALYPGGSTTLSGDFDNSNPGSVYVGTVTATIGTLPSGCIAADFTLTTDHVDVNAEVDSGNAKGAWSGIVLKMNDTGVSQDACQTTSIPIHYTIS